MTTSSKVISTQVRAEPRVGGRAWQSVSPSDLGVGSLYPPHVCNWQCLNWGVFSMYFRPCQNIDKIKNSHDNMFSFDDSEIDVKCAQSPALGPCTGVQPFGARSRFTPRSACCHGICTNIHFCTDLNMATIICVLTGSGLDVSVLCRARALLPRARISPSGPGLGSRVRSCTGGVLLSK
jgi:hypothetical protein